RTRLREFGAFANDGFPQAQELHKANAPNSRNVCKGGGIGDADHTAASVSSPTECKFTIFTQPV
ncbi:MAG: hypothetical protein JXR37_01915, partial [Kiritimatiellae bacterium]|nr:hypothetical protein [Kiritimatiellia bacterium]